MTDRQALVAELAEHCAIAARLAAALADTPDDGDGCAYLPEDAQRGRERDDRSEVRAEACAADPAATGREES